MSNLQADRQYAAANIKNLGHYCMQKGSDFSNSIRIKSIASQAAIRTPATIASLKIYNERRHLQLVVMTMDVENKSVKMWQTCEYLKFATRFTNLMITLGLSRNINLKH